MDLTHTDSEKKLADLFAAYRLTTSEEERNAVADQIFELIYTPLALFISGRRIDPNKLDDVVQEALVGIFKGIPVFRGTTHQEAWKFCYRVAFNKAMNSIRDSKSKPRRHCSGRRT